MNNLTFFILLIFFLPALTHTSSVPFIPSSSPLFTYQGRFLQGANSTMLFDWSASSVQFLIANTSSFSLVFGDTSPSNWYTLILDDRPFAQTPSPASLRYSWEISGLLPSRAYRATFFKRTEAANNRQPSVFYGLSVPHSAVLRPLPDPPLSGRKLLFFGDSLTAGYGVLGNASSDCSQAESALEDNWYDYSSLLARIFSAEYQVVAISGRGVVRNYGDPSTQSSCPNCPMPHYFNKTCLTSDLGVPYDFPAFVPHAIVCNLGTNDFSTLPHPTAQEFIQGYLGLLQSFRKAYPAAVIFLACGPEIDQPCCGYVQSVAAGFPGTVYIDLQDILSEEDQACGHPNVHGQQLMAYHSAPIIAHIMHWDH